MNEPETLNEMEQLKKSGFGRPYPRHGLKLLYWFANDCLYFDNDNKMCWNYDPEEGHFGFKFFENRDKLLPEVNLDYYEVGNLSKAYELPDYVREDYTQNDDDCDRNTDRIIVSVDYECFNRVYVTEHSDQTRFNRDATYRISRGLIMNIKKLTLEDFLMKTGYTTRKKDTDWRIEDSLNKDTDQGTEDSPDKDTDQTGLHQRTKEETGNIFPGTYDPEKRCTCIIL
ncbi:uncharacterized protein LOC132889762 [Neoarius graeffei]|uniref:uncharacterized protein LOC132889762 n=1 Tax=Neoarius graeffei TaxID=443677 RepID=UPI00298C82C8|nr:uncharacterized protein LOC132889762 [Neoarius graeffei]XP_060782555.1 uncharacterized protein LOC132889762 [Neoarius graeffei]XP_060782556.1 uncharacterized protein LOC132889762 [Neoarius graeffei]